MFLIADVTDKCMPTFHVAFASDLDEGMMELEVEGQRWWVEYKPFVAGEPVALQNRVRTIKLLGEVEGPLMEKVAKIEAEADEAIRAALRPLTKV